MMLISDLNIFYYISSLTLIYDMHTVFTLILDWHAALLLLLDLYVVIIIIYLYFYLIPNGNQQCRIDKRGLKKAGIDSLKNSTN